MKSRVSRKKSSYVEHLSELRKRLISCLIAMAVGLATALPLATFFVKLLQRPLWVFTSPEEMALRALAPQETIVLWFRVGLYAAFLIASPYLLYQAWAFVSPGLRRREKRALIPTLLAGTLLMLGGISFAYFLILPLALSFLMKFSLSMEISPEWTIGYYINFALKLVTAFALAFELPLLLTLLVYFGLLEVNTLARYRRHAIVGIFCLSAAITPPDPVTMLTLAMPLVVLFELTIWTSRLLMRKRKRKR